MSASFDNDPDFTGITWKPKTVRTFPFGKFLLGLAIIAVVLAFLLPATRSVRIPSRRMECASNLRHITIALAMYEQDHHAFPPAYTVDANGKPLHSWRTLILPYLGEESLYKQIDLSKPWDDPANAAACAMEEWPFICRAANPQGNTTTYLAIVGPGSFLMPDLPRRKGEITDGHASTLAVIEVGAEDAVPWMAPIDADASTLMKIDGKAKLSHAGGMNASFIDGSVRFLDADMPAPIRRALLSIAGGEVVSADEL